MSQPHGHKTYQESPIPKLRDPDGVCLHQAMMDAAPDAILLAGLDGRIIEINSAAHRAGGFGAGNAPLSDWLDWVGPEAEDDARRSFATAKQGELARFSLTTHGFGSTTIWDMSCSPVKDEAGTIVSILLIGRDITATHNLGSALAEASAREKLVTQEMRHRIKNLFSVVSVLITMAERETRTNGKPEELGPVLKAKMNALARASEATYVENHVPLGMAPNAGAQDFDLHRVVSAILSPYAPLLSIHGPEAVTSRQNMTTLTLLLHELATNSAKYGALGCETGHIAIEWHEENSVLTLTWTETGGPILSAAPDNIGFGSAMIDRLISMAGGSLERNWHPEGLIAQLTLPSSAQATDTP